MKNCGPSAKGIIHNQALQLLDALIGTAVEEGPRADPPVEPIVGSCFIVASDPSGAWAGHAHQLAFFSAGGWRFIAPPDGLKAYVRSSAIHAMFRNGAWELGDVRGSRVLINGEQVVGSRSPAIPAPSGGTSIDVEARGAIGEILGALRLHGLIAT